MPQTLNPLSSLHSSRARPSLLEQVRALNSQYRIAAIGTPSSLPTHSSLSSLNPRVEGQSEWTAKAYLPCPADLAERAAILTELVGMPLDDAHAAALGDAGLATTDALADVLKSHVLAELARVDPVAAKDAHRLMAVTKAFVASHHFSDAVAHGWSLHELFAARIEAPTRRPDGMGLVVVVALSRLGSRLEAIECDHAILRAKSGGALTYLRFVARLESSRPWWECPTLCRPASAKRESTA